LVLADESAYTYAKPVRLNSLMPPTEIHVVTVATAADRVVYTRGTSEAPIKFADEGIYLVTPGYESWPVGLRLLDPRTGTVRVISASGTWGVISHGAAWGINAAFTGHDSNPSRIDRLDLATGAVTTWYEAPKDTWVWALGLDFSGALLIGVFGVTREFVEQVEDVYRLDGPARVRHLFTAKGDTAILTPWSYVADSHGLWFVYRYWLWLYSENGGLRAVADTSRLVVGGMNLGRFAGPSLAGVAGPCQPLGELHRT
jgi:hypothetical protein